MKLILLWEKKEKEKKKKKKKRRREQALGFDALQMLLRPPLRRGRTLMTMTGVPVLTLPEVVAEARATSPWFEARPPDTPYWRSIRSRSYPPHSTF